MSIYQTAIEAIKINNAEHKAAQIKLNKEFEQKEKELIDELARNCRKQAEAFVSHISPEFYSAINVVTKGYNPYCQECFIKTVDKNIVINKRELIENIFMWFLNSFFENNNEYLRKKYHGFMSPISSLLITDDYASNSFPGIQPGRTYIELCNSSSAAQLIHEIKNSGIPHEIIESDSPTCVLFKFNVG